MKTTPSIYLIASKLNCTPSIYSAASQKLANFCFQPRPFSTGSCYGESGSDGNDSTGGSSSSGPTYYDIRKYSHTLPVNNVNVYFPPLPNIPTGIFRNTDGEVLGFGAGKCCPYKNPEYFSYHHMTYYDMHLIMRCFRQPSPKTGRKP